MTDLESSAIMGGITQMGARVYLPILGRFLQVDPVEGGTDNNYVYANDPVNEFDLDGKAIPILFLLSNVARVAAPHVARAAVKYIAKPAAKFAAKRAVPLLKKGAGHVARWGVNGARKVWSGVRVFSRSIIQKARNTYSTIRTTIVNGNNLIRIGKGRISIGPAPKHYGSGRFGSRIPLHIHIERGKLLIQKSRTGKVWRCWGRKCY